MIPDQLLQDVVSINLGSVGSVAIFAGIAVTTGASPNIYGDVVVVAAVTTGASANIYGDVAAGAAVTTGASANFYGDVAGAALTRGAAAVIHGDFEPTTVRAIATWEDFHIAYAFEGTQTRDCPLTDGAFLQSGVYAYSGDLSIPADAIITIIGDATDTFIFQVTGAVAIGAKVVFNLEAKGDGLPTHSNVVWAIDGTLTAGAEAKLQGVFLINAAATLVSLACTAGF